MGERLYGLDLYNYLLGLSAELTLLGKEDAASQVAHTSKFISGSMSELFGESAALLPKILRDHGDQMTEPGRYRLRQAIDAIEREFQLIGGA